MAASIGLRFHSVTLMQINFELPGFNQETLFLHELARLPERVSSFGPAPMMRFFASYLIRVRPNAIMDPGFLSHFFDSPGYWEQIAQKAVGAAQPGVNSTKLKELQVPLPSLVTQRHIATVLDQADQVRRNRLQTLKILESLPQAFFVESFGDPVVNPRAWPLKLLGDVGDLERGHSKHRPRNDPDLLNGPYPLIQTGDVANCDGYIRHYTSTYSEAGLRQSRMWPKGTLCITIAANIGKTGILTFESCFPDSVVGFKPGPTVRTEYVQCWMSFIQKSLEDNAPQFAQKNINLATLRELQIPIPPLNVQRAFVEKIQGVYSLKDQLSKHLGELSLLFASLQNQAFLGEL